LELEKEVLRKAIDVAGSSSPGRQTTVTRETLYGFTALLLSGEDHLPRPSPVPGPAGQQLGVLRLDPPGQPRLSINTVIADDDLDDAHAANVLHDAWADHRRTYGARRLTAEIRDRGPLWNRTKVSQLMTHLMTSAGIEGIQRRRHGKKRSRLAVGVVAPDLVKRKFDAEQPDQLRVADISDLRTWEGFLGRAVVIDA
jgi:hypothetical protein